MISFLIVAKSPACRKKVKVSATDKLLSLAQNPLADVGSVAWLKEVSAETRAMKGGQGKMQVGDTLWRVESAINYPAGTQVKVVGSRDMVLLVIKAGADTE